MENYRMKRISLISLIFVGLLSACSGMAENTASREAAQERRVKAEAMFQERCKKSGVFIHRTAENVEGVFLLKIREQTSRGDQYKMDDPYGHDSSNDAYIRSFLLGRDKDGYLVKDSPISKGFSYIDAIDPQDGKRYRYTGRIDQPWLRDKRYGEWVREFVLDKVLTPDPAPRYGVTYDDISTREERDYWIAGSSLKVIDLQTNEVMAERIGYMMDRRQGNNTGGRAPWLLAANYACPSYPKNGGRGDQGEQTRRFVEKTLKPSQER
jgi:hypothetical protein